VFPESVRLASLVGNLTVTSSAVRIEAPNANKAGITALGRRWTPTFWTDFPQSRCLLRWLLRKRVLTILSQLHCTRLPGRSPELIRIEILKGNRSGVEYLWSRLNCL